MNTMLLRQAPPVFCFRCGGTHFIDHPDGWQCDLRRNGCGQIHYKGEPPGPPKTQPRHLGRRRN